MTSLQPREQGRARALSPLGCHCAADFQEALGPRRGWLGPLGGAGLLAGLPLPPPGWASRHTRGRIVPTAVPGPESTSGHCACAHRAWAEASVAARQPCRAAWQLPHPSLDPALPQPVGETDVGGHRQPLVLFCDSLPVTSHGGPCSLGPPSAFQGPAFPQGALTWDHRGRGQRLPTLLLCGEGNRGPQMTFAEFTGPSRKTVRNADLDATQAAIRPPALSSSCCATSCK